MNDYSNLPTAEEYRASIHVLDTGRYSEPKYQCPKCDGGMCKNMFLVLTSFPPKYEYVCNKCGHVEYQYK